MYNCSSTLYIHVHTVLVPNVCTGTCTCTYKPKFGLFNFSYIHVHVYTLYNPVCQFRVHLKKVIFSLTYSVAEIFKA